MNNPFETPVKRNGIMILSNGSRIKATFKKNLSKALVHTSRLRGGTCRAIQQVAATNGKQSS